MNGLLPDHIAIPIPVRALSSTPGRVRVRVGRDYREPEILTEIASALQTFATEISRVKANPTTGSLTIYYDPGIGDLANTFVMLQDLGMITNEQSPPSATPDRSAVAANITGVLTGWNQRVYQFTAGSLDLKSLVPFLLGSWALRQFVKGNAATKFVPWYALAWYAFDTFVKLNKSSEVPWRSLSPGESPSSTDDNGHLPSPVEQGLPHDSIEK
jgi:Heavy metal associated domain 2